MPFTRLAFRLLAENFPFTFHPRVDIPVDVSRGASLDEIRASVPLVSAADLKAPVKEHWRDREKRLAEENLAKRASEDKIARAVGRDDIEYDHEY